MELRFGGRFSIVQLLFVCNGLGIIVALVYWADVFYAQYVLRPCHDGCVPYVVFMMATLSKNAK